MNRIALVISISVMLLLSCERYLGKSIESPVVDNNSVTFRLKNQAAEVVQVAGDWNNWSEGDADEGEVFVGLMTRNDSVSCWERTVELERGRYKYRFLINESVWLLDSNNPRIVNDGKGGKANLLIVP